MRGRRRASCGARSRRPPRPSRRRSRASGRRPPAARRGSARPCARPPPTPIATGTRPSARASKAITRSRSAGTDERPVEVERRDEDLADGLGRIELAPATSAPTEATPHDRPPMPNRATSRRSHRSRTARTPACASSARFVAASSSRPGRHQPVRLGAERVGDPADTARARDRSTSSRRPAARPWPRPAWPPRRARPRPRRPRRHRRPRRSPRRGRSRAGPGPRADRPSAGSGPRGRRASARGGPRRARSAPGARPRPATRPCRGRRSGSRRCPRRGRASGGG